MKGNQWTRTYKSAYPAGQGMHAEPFHICEATHAKHMGVPPAEAVSGGHARHAVLPVTLLKEPEGHGIARPVPLQ